MSTTTDINETSPTAFLFAGSEQGEPGSTLYCERQPTGTELLNDYGLVGLIGFIRENPRLELMSYDVIQEPHSMAIIKLEICVNQIVQRLPIFRRGLTDEAPQELIVEESDLPTPRQQEEAIRLRNYSTVGRTQKPVKKKKATPRFVGPDAPLVGGVDNG